MKNVLLVVDAKCATNLEKLSTALNKQEFDNIYLLSLVFMGSIMSAPISKQIEIMANAKNELENLANALHIPLPNAKVEIELAASFDTVRSFVRDFHINDLIIACCDGNPVYANRLDIKLGNKCRIEIIE